MADKDAEEPSLELPSLGLRRRRPKRRPEAAAPVTRAEPQPAPAPAREAPTQPIEAVPDAAGTSAPAAAPAATPAPVAPRADTGPGLPPTDTEQTAGRPRRKVSLPRIGGLPAAVLTGVLVGVITVGLTWGGFRLCEVVRGTSSCGDPGFLLLLAILVAMVLLGSSLLRAWGLPDPGSTSFLGVGVLAVMVLLFLVEAIFSWWMVLVIPAVAAASFALAHWVTTYVGDSG